MSRRFGDPCSEAAAAAAEVVKMWTKWWAAAADEAAPSLPPSCCWKPGGKSKVSYLHGRQRKIRRKVIFEKSLQVLVEETEFFG